MWRDNAVRLGLVLVLAVSAAACAAILGDDFEVVETTSSTGSGGGSATGGGTATGTGVGGGSTALLVLSADPDTLRIVRGASADVQVDVDRQGAVGDVTVSLSDLPSGVTADPMLVTASETSTTITINVGAQAALGPATPRLVDDGSLAVPVDLSLLVADPPGTLDETFDEDGVLDVQPTGGDQDAEARAVAVQADGQLIVGGYLNSPATGWAVLRIASDGTADTAFNDNAAAAMPSDGQLWSVAIDPINGRILAVGESSSQLTVVKLNTTGTADGSFGTGGLIRLSSLDYSQGTIGMALAVQPDGKIVAAGRETSSPSRGLVVRFESSGSFDTSFATDGVFEETGSNGTSFRGVLVDPADHIVAVGSASGSHPPRFWATRLTAAGAKDTTFASAGSATVGDGHNSAADVAREADGHLVLCGGDSDGTYIASLARLTSAGATAWPAPGVIDYAINGANDRAEACAVHEDGHILFVGWGQNAATHNGYLTRIDTAGSLDTTFGDQGSVMFEDPTGPPPPGYSLDDLAIQADGRIVVVGNKTDAGWFIARVWN